MADLLQLTGVFANLALIVNVLILLGLMSAFEATMTLPGIAGVVLTVGMAVDSNVIIYERIREELRLGKTPQGGDPGRLLALVLDDLRLARHDAALVDHPAC